MTLRVPPLALDSPRWRELHAHFENAGEDGGLPAVPTLLARWHAAVGTYAEEYEHEDLFESYLHQLTLQDVAYAVLPHIASRFTELDPDRQQDLLEGLAVVDSVRRLSPEEVERRVAGIGELVHSDLRDNFMQSARSRLAPLPEDLAPAYAAASEHLDVVAPGWRDTPLSELHPTDPRVWRRHVRYLRESGSSDADIIAAVNTLREPEPEYGGAVIYALSRAEAHERIAGRVPGGELGFRAVHSLAWWAKLDIAKALGASPN